ncbi:MAG TPA: efflux RND transporter permease subunit, partial [Gemmataceae bacterium]|nr:efflux RND transporter permease subunit [Gemmataceae bacterium]
GLSRQAATIEACRLRLRPILMTSFAFILGVVPLMLATGAGAEMRRSLGTAVFSGMLGVTLFGIFLTPVFFNVIEWCIEHNVLSRGFLKRAAHAIRRAGKYSVRIISTLAGRLGQLVRRKPAVATPSRVPVVAQRNGSTNGAHDHHKQDPLQESRV